MSRIKSRDTSPERKVRKLLHAAGIRFRLHRKDLPGTPDIVLPRWRAVIEVQGCFWHAHGCHLFVRPQQNSSFWSEKHRRNCERDRRNSDQLKALGLRRLVVWECAMEGRERLEDSELAEKLAIWVRGTEMTGEIRGQPSSR